MNRYTLSSTALIRPFEEDKQESFHRALSQVVKSFAHCVLFGEDQRVETDLVRYYNDVTKEIVNSKGSTITFSLPYSLSSVITEDYVNQFTKGYTPMGSSFVPADTSLKIAFSESSYATNSQEVREYVDKPYPRKGYLVCFLIEKGDTDFRGDLDGYVKMPFSFYRAEKDAQDKIEFKVEKREIVFGYVNTSQTDFYKPLAKYVASGLIEIIDSASANAETVVQGALTLRHDLAGAIKGGAINQLNRIDVSNTPLAQVATKFRSY